MRPSRCAHPSRAQDPACSARRHRYASRGGYTENKKPLAQIEPGVFPQFSHRYPLSHRSSRPDNASARDVTSCHAFTDLQNVDAQSLRNPTRCRGLADASRAFQEYRKLQVVINRSAIQSSRCKRKQLSIGGLLLSAMSGILTATGAFSSDRGKSLRTELNDEG